MNYKKLLGIATAVTTIGAYSFNFVNFNSKDSWIREGIDRIKAVALGYKAQLEKLQGEYNTLLGDLNSTQDALAQARLKLEAIYQKITGQEWTGGDILEFDFDTLLKDGDQFENNVDGDAIADILGLPHGSSTEDIIAAIQDLIATVQSLEQRITVLEGQVASLEAEIAEYQTEQDSLVEEIDSLKNKLDAATEQANEIINGASQEEQGQMDYINDTLEELGAEPVEEPKEEVTMTEEQQALWNTYIDAVNASNLNESWKEQLSNSTLYPVIERNGDFTVFKMIDSTTGELVKQYDSVNSGYHEVYNAYQAYLASMNS